MRGANRSRLARSLGMMPSMHRHLAVCPARLSYPLVPSLMNGCHDHLAVLCIGPCAGRSSIVEIIPDLAAREDLGGHHLGMHVSLLIAQEESVHTVALGPELRVWNADGRARGPGGAADDEGVNAFGSDHA